MYEEYYNNNSTSTTKDSGKAVMDDQLTDAFESLIIQNQPEETNQIAGRKGIRDYLNDSKNDNSIRSPRLKGCQEKKMNVFCDLQEPATTTIQHQDVCQNNITLLKYDTVDHQAIDLCDMATLMNPNPCDTNIVNDVQNTSVLKTPVQNIASIKKHTVRSSPRINNKKEEICLAEDKIINDNIPDPVSSSSPLETPYHTPKAEEGGTNVRKINDKSVWSTPQNKSRHQQRRIHIKTIPEVISENVPDIVTSTPFKSCDVLPESPGLEHIYPKVVSPSANEQSFTSPKFSYSSSEDVLSTESSICSTSSISKANVSFGIAKVYCFDRCFGIDTVPEEGNFALGMSQVAWEAVDCPIYDNSEELSKSMQKLTIDQRRTLLEESCGSVELDKVDEEDDTCRSPEIEVIRNDRKQVGCHCIGACNPATCECALSEIECQVERAGWPCGCTKQRCKNPEGRRQYQQAKIKKETRIKIMQTVGKVEKVGKVGKGQIRRSV